MRSIVSVRERAIGMFAPPLVGTSKAVPLAQIAMRDIVGMQSILAQNESDTQTYLYMTLDRCDITYRLYSSHSFAILDVLTGTTA